MERMEHYLKALRLRQDVPQYPLPLDFLLQPHAGQPNEEIQVQLILKVMQQHEVQKILKQLQGYCFQILGK